MSLINLSQQQIDAIRAILATKAGRFDNRLDYTAEGVNTLLRGEAIEIRQFPKLYAKAVDVMRVLGFEFGKIDPNEPISITEQSYRLIHVLDVCGIEYNLKRITDMVMTPKHWDKPDL